jgi:hypothetical protein
VAGPYRRRVLFRRRLLYSSSDSPHNIH